MTHKQKEQNQNKQILFFKTEHYYSSLISHTIELYNRPSPKNFRFGMYQSGDAIFNLHGSRAASNKSGTSDRTKQI